MIRSRRRPKPKNVIQKEVRRRRSKIVERTRPVNDSRRGYVLRLIYGFLMLFVLGVALYMVFFSGTFNIQSVVVVGTENISDDRIEEHIDSETEGKTFGFISARNILLFNKKRAEARLIEDIAQIRTVELKKQFPNIIKVYIEEREPVAVWKTSENKYYLDLDGVISKSFVGESEFELPFLEDESNDEVQAREQIVSSDFVNFFVELARSFKLETGLEFNRFFTPTRISREVNVETSEGWNIYFTSGLALDSQYRKLLLTLNKELSKERREGLEYIDLRIQDKIFYK